MILSNKTLLPIAHALKSISTNFRKKSVTLTNFTHQVWNHLKTISSIKTQHNLDIDAIVLATLNLSATVYTSINHC